MKRSATVLALLLLTLPLAALAEDGYCALYVDLARSSCAIEDHTPAVVIVHMFAEGIAKLIAVEMAAPIPDCWTGATWLGDVIPHEVVIGNSQQEDGLTVFVGAPGTGNCETAVAPDPAYIGYMTILAQGTAGPCCEHRILPSGPARLRGFDQPLAAVCGGGGPTDIRELAVGSHGAMINANGSCPCEASQAVAVEETSWGRVKALYR